MPEQTIALTSVKAVIFDMDGTLYRQASLRRAMAVRLVRAHLLRPRHGLRMVRVLSAYRRAQEDLRATAGQTDLADAQLRLAAERTGVDQDEVARCVEHWMDAAPLPLLARFGQPGMSDALHTLRSWGLRLAVLSDYPVTAKLDALGIADLFDVVLCAQEPEIGVFKPNPRGLEVALERLGISAADALYVGDRADIDAVAAAAAHIPCAILGASGPAGSDDGFVRITSFQDMQERLEPR